MSAAWPFSAFESLKSFIKELTYFRDSYEFYQAPMGGGRVALTECLIHDENHFRNTVLAYEKKSFSPEEAESHVAQYQALQKKLLLVDSQLAQYVSSDTFMEHWHSLTLRQQDSLLYITDNSYAILRERLSFQDIGVLCVQDIIESSSLDKFYPLMQDLTGLPFVLPQNRMQTLQQKKLFLSLGVEPHLMEKHESYFGAWAIRALTLALYQGEVLPQKPELLSLDRAQLLVEKLKLHDMPMQDLAVIELKNYARLEKKIKKKLKH